MIEVGQEYSISYSFTQTDVDNFAKLCGDTNPIHINPEYAKKSIFGRLIIHGYLGASIFSKVLGTIFPGEGTIYLSQTIKFYNPMFTDEIYTAKFEVLEVMREKHRAKIKTTVLNDKEEIIQIGEALIMNKEKI
ncbi:MAG: dehydrogenase [Bacteroidetes bacterium GWA2_32_17]|nr:MAG: dehydrogenase [Bacteroidetes bacterium GWA2_32_17]